jgi:hypothetical protein
MPSSPNDLSRRVFLKRVATCGAGAAIIQGLGSSVANAQAKAAQQAVSYQDKPKGEQHCEICSSFQPPSGCKLVDGQISPQGWCSLFTKKS